MRTPLACFVAFAGTAGALGCHRATLGAPTALPDGWDRIEGAVVEMEPFRIDLTKAGEGYEAAYGEAAPLFEEAAALVAAGDLAGAAVLYDRVADAFEDSRYARAARYNAGLMLEALGRFEEAVPHYEEVAKAAAGTPDGADALFRLGHCLGRLGKWERVRDVFRSVVAAHELNASDEIEARTRLGVALAELGSVVEAETELRAVLARRKEIERVERLESPWFWAQAQFYLGEVLRLRSNAVALDARDKGTLARDLEARSRLLLEARRAYLDAVEVHNLYWATAAGLRLGELFEDYRRALVDAPLPPELDTPEKAASYRSLLADELDPVLYKAIAVYRSALDMAARTGARNQWVKATVERIETLVALARAEGWIALPAGDAPGKGKAIEVTVANESDAPIVVALTGYVSDSRTGDLVKLAPSVEVAPGAEKVMTLRAARYAIEIKWTGAPVAGAGGADPAAGADKGKGKGAKGKGAKGPKAPAAATGPAPAIFTGEQAFHPGFVYRARIGKRAPEGALGARPAPEFDGAPVLPDVAPGSGPRLSLAEPAAPSIDSPAAAPGTPAAAIGPAPALSAAPPARGPRG